MDSLEQKEKKNLLETIKQEQKKWQGYPDFVKVIQKHWKDMPEFVQKSNKEHFMVVVNLKNEEDIKAFGELIGQKLTNKTNAIWYPKKASPEFSKRRYVDES